MKVGRKKYTEVLGPEIIEALAKLKKLAQVGNDRPRLMVEVAALRKKGVPVGALADCCSVSTRTINLWSAGSRKLDTTPVRQNSKRGLTPERIPQMQILDVVRPERVGGFWPRVNLRAEWVRFRFNLELF
jgi:hypothetical protein